MCTRYLLVRRSILLRRLQATCWQISEGILSVPAFLPILADWVAPVLRSGNNAVSRLDPETVTRSVSGGQGRILKAVSVQSEHNALCRVTRSGQASWFACAGLWLDRLTGGPPIRLLHDFGEAIRSGKCRGVSPGVLDVGDCPCTPIIAEFREICPAGRISDMCDFPNHRAAWDGGRHV